VANLIIFISKDGEKIPKNYNFLWIFSLFEQFKIHQVAKIHPKKKKTPMKNIMMMIKVSIPNIDWRGRRNFWKVEEAFH
jgi:hypothetical protein